jgi:DNA invertase Pin-like site-specific DNA recombinase
MMPGEAHQKITASHLARTAFLYVRQSTLRQVLENTESTTRQYALRNRAIALGWPIERIVVIDTDLGQSGASAADREGFQRLVTEVGLGRAGIVLGLEVSRLARNNTDWHRLLELCALTDTLILDEDGLYDPAHFNDRLLLGLKGTMSEAELHVLRARLRGGILSRARRGELKQPLPIGFVYDAAGRVILDPDAQVQAAVRLLFATFQRTGSCLAVTKVFREQQLSFPRRIRSGPKKGHVHWDELLQCRVLQIMHNPRYAGAFVFGRTRQRRRPNGKTESRQQPVEDWILIRDAHPGYVTWAQYEENVRRVQANAAAWGTDRRQGPPREGNALLQGLLICGICGERMTVRYHTHHGQAVPTYWCGRRRVQHGETGLCQVIHGASLDAMIGDILVEMMTPLTIEVALAVQQELTAREEDADRFRRQQVERARYEADLAQRRFLQVDPDHRLVADALEADWNAKLRALAAAQEKYEQAKIADARATSEAERANLFALATDFPRLWHDPSTAMKEKKRMVRLLIADVTLLKHTQLTAHIRFCGGAARSLVLPTPLSAADLRRTDAAVVSRVDELLDDYTEKEVADRLNEAGLRTGTGLSFNLNRVARIRQTYNLKTRYERLREKGLLDLHEMAAALNVDACTVKIWRTAGLLPAYAYNSKNECLYEPPGPDRPRKHVWKGISGQRRTRTATSRH